MTFSRFILPGLILLLNVQMLSAQKFYTRAGEVAFQASTAMENVSASSRAVVAMYDASNGNIQIEVFIKGFEFRKALMQEHFNENYMESDKFPKAIFVGFIKAGKYEPATSSPQKVTVAGKLTLHGVTQSIEVSGSMTNVNGYPQLNAVFAVRLEDYQIRIPALVKDKIASTAEISFNSLLNKTLK